MRKVAFYKSWCKTLSWHNIIIAFPLIISISLLHVNCKAQENVPISKLYNKVLSQERYINAYISGNTIYKDSLQLHIKDLNYLIAHKNSTERIKTKAYCHLAVIYQLGGLNQKDSAIFYANAAIDNVTKDLSQPHRGNILAEMYFARGTAEYTEFKNKERALHSLLTALKNDADPGTRFLIYNSLGEVFASIKVVDSLNKAIYYYEQAVAIAPYAIKMQSLPMWNEGIPMINIAILLAQEYDIATNNHFRMSSKSYLDKAQASFAAAGVNNISVYYYACAEYYNALSDYNSALVYIDSALNTPLKYASKEYNGRFCLIRGRALLHLKDTSNALKVIEAINYNELDEDYLKLTYHNLLYKCLKENNATLALRQLEQYTFLKDSLDIGRVSQNIFYLNKKYDLAKKDLDISMLKEERIAIELKVAELKRQRVEKDLAIARLEQTHAKNDLAIANLERRRAQDDLAIAQLEKQRIQKSLSIIKLQRQRNNIIAGGALLLLLAIAGGAIYYTRYRNNKKHLALSIQQLQRAAEMEELKIREATARVTEEEHHRIGSELHNDLAATIAAAASFLHSKKVGVTEKEDYELMAQQLKLAYEKTRKRSHILYDSSITDDDFFAELEEMMKTFFSGSGIAVTMNMDIAESRLPAATKICLLHILKETATNILKHAKANKVSVLLYFDPCNLHLKITDDGIGYHKGKKGIGLKSLEGEIMVLKGQLEIKQAGKGTLLYATWPL